MSAYTLRDIYTQYFIKLLIARTKMFYGEYHCEINYVFTAQLIGAAPTPDDFKEE